MPVSILNSFCRRGSLDDRAITVLDACERAVLLSHNEGSIRDSRGLALALTGRTKDAIKDFEFYVKWLINNNGLEEKINQRKGWITELQVGRNPFTKDLLKKLKGE